MKRRAFVLALPLLLLAAEVLQAADGDLFASWLTPTLELGDIVPMAPETPGAPATVMVFSRGTYQLALVRGAREGGPPRGGDADDLRVRTSTGSFVPLPPGVPVMVTSGNASSGAGLVVPIELRASATWDSTPGTRRERIRLFLNGQPVEAELSLRWTVTAAFTVAPDSRPFNLNSVEPGAPGRYPLEPRSYLVTSNVPWRLEAFVHGAPRQRGTREALAAESLEVSTQADGRKPLRPGVPVVVATGPPTGRSGRAVDLRLLLKSDGDETAGLYKGEVEVRVRPQSDAPSASAEGSR